jgi:hypothetical protein
MNKGAIFAVLGAFFLLGKAICAGAISVDNEPVTHFQAQLKFFAAKPTLNALRDLLVLCRQLPVRDLKPGQIGQGHPQDRDVKLASMLQFFCVLDTLKNAPAPVSKLPKQQASFSDNPPQEDPAAVEYWNLHQKILNSRDDLAQVDIADFIKYECRVMPKDHLRSVVVRELKSDPDAYATQITLLRVIDSD